MPASRELSIDFGQMPWSQSPASWRYHGESVWNALCETLEVGGRVTVSCPASAHPHLQGLLVLEGDRFRAEVTITSHADPSDLADLRKGRHTQLLHGLDVSYAAHGQDALTIAVEAPLEGQHKDRIRTVLDTAWDLQLLAVGLLSQRFGISEDVPIGGAETLGQEQES